MADPQRAADILSLLRKGVRQTEIARKLGVRPTLVAYYAVRLRKGRAKEIAALEGTTPTAASLLTAQKIRDDPEALKSDRLRAAAFIHKIEKEKAKEAEDSELTEGEFAELMAVILSELHPRVRENIAQLEPVIDAGEFRKRTVLITPEKRDARRPPELDELHLPHAERGPDDSNEHGTEHGVGPSEPAL